MEEGKEEEEEKGKKEEEKGKKEEDEKEERSFCSRIQLILQLIEGEVKQ